MLGSQICTCWIKTTQWTNKPKDFSFYFNVGVYLQIWGVYRRCVDKPVNQHPLPQSTNIKQGNYCYNSLKKRKKKFKNVSPECIKCTRFIQLIVSQFIVWFTVIVHVTIRRMKNFWGKKKEKKKLDEMRKEKLRRFSSLQQWSRQVYTLTHPMLEREQKGISFLRPLKRV